MVLKVATRSTISRNSKLYTINNTLMQFLRKLLLDVRQWYFCSWPRMCTTPICLVHIHLLCLQSPLLVVTSDTSLLMSQDTNLKDPNTHLFHTPGKKTLLHFQKVYECTLLLLMCGRHNTTKLCKHGALSRPPQPLMTTRWKHTQVNAFLMCC